MRGCRFNDRIPAARMIFSSALVVVAASTVLAAEPTAEQLVFFENKIRPLLVEHCFKCHGPDKHQGNLRLDSLEAITLGGDSGPAAVPGEPKESLLIEAIGYDGVVQMPPSGKLKDDQIALLTRWVDMGLPWPQRKDGEKKPLVPRQAGLEITDHDRAWWSFRPIERPPLPEVRNAAWVSNPIDLFILRKLEGQNLAPAPQATSRELARRLFFDLVGLPPTPEELDALLAAADDPLAYERLVDDLLARPQFGERWARHWLDLVRFAQTNGYERDDEKPQAWRYRDYVVRAFNEDKPYDRFVIEQLAGDEVDHITDDSLTATGFYRLGVWDDEPDDRLEARFEELDDILSTTSSTFLGLTVGCARCHDHKFDPIPQEDYYRLLSFFQNISLYGSEVSSTHFKANQNGIFTPLASLAEAEEWKAKQDELYAQIKPLEGKLNALNEQDDDAKKASEEERKTLEKQIGDLKAAANNAPFVQVLSIREKPAETEPLNVLVRGNPRSPGKAVEPNYLQVLERDDWTADRAVAPAADDVRRQALHTLGVVPSSGRRRALAEWLVSREHPLTARVIVNRLWQHHFGRGLVPTPSDFGHTGELPSHPELLDWLASELMDHGWSLKYMHRLILTSSTYRQSSRIDEDAAVTIDPGNTLLWRQNLRRLEAEAIRDSVLAVSGALNPQMRGRGIFPLLAPEVLATQSRPGAGWDDSDEWQRNRRSIYIFVKRTLNVPLMEAFDVPTPDKPGPNRSVTTIAPQALMFLNSEFLDANADAFAHRLQNECGDDRDAQIERAFRLALGRSPSEEEFAQSVAFIERQDSLPAICKLLMNLNEFVYVD